MDEIEVKVIGYQETIWLNELGLFFKDRDIESRIAAGLCGRMLFELYKLNTPKQHYVEMLRAMELLWDADGRNPSYPSYGSS